MNRILLYLSLMAMSLNAAAQTPGTYTYLHKQYYVYPFKIYNGEIPLIGYKIPDGEYIAFSSYNFKPKFSLKKKKSYKLTDTTRVSALFSVKNGLADGKATFYSYTNKKNGNEKLFSTETGQLISGLKEGLWVETRRNSKTIEYTNYKSGMRQGYHYYTDEFNNITFTEKYCENSRCDTITVYKNGKPNTQYDINEFYFTTVEKRSCYDLAAQLFGLQFENVKSFYKEYDNGGKLIIDLKYDNGNLLPFDSIGRAKLINKKQVVDYVKFYRMDKNDKVMTCVKHNNDGKQVYLNYYDDNFLSKAVEISYTYRKKRTDSVVTEEIFVDPSLINNNSTEPVLVGIHHSYGFKEETYYIPAYGILYDQNLVKQFNRLDTINRELYLTSINKSYKGYKKETVSKIFSKKQQLVYEYSKNPYLQKSFSINNHVPNFTDLCSDYDPYQSNSGFKTTDCYELDQSSLYYKNDTLLNGLYYFGYAKKQKNQSSEIIYAGYANFESQFSKGKFVNGKKEGPWESVETNAYPKKLPADLKQYFLHNPKKSESYELLTYKDNQLNGLQTYYDSYDPVDDDYKSKEPKKLYKAKEAYFFNDTLHGSYKTYYHNSQLAAEANFIMGSPDGEYKSYDISGKISDIIHFNKGQLDGSYTEYQEDRVVMRANYKNNMLADSLVAYNVNSKPFMKVFAKNDTLIKKQSYFDEGQLKEEINFHPNSGYVFDRECMSSESYIEMLNSIQNENTSQIQASYKSYYSNGQLLCSGEIVNGTLLGDWRFYALNGALIHAVNFCDTAVTLPNANSKTNIDGFYTGFYANGNKRCEGYIKDMSLSYDCFTKQDKAELDFFAINFYDINNKQILKNGTGYFVKYDANGVRVSSGKLLDCIEDSLWRYYTPEQKLEETGYFVSGKKEGVWYVGDLEGINFEDGACFDMENPNSVKEYHRKQKEIYVKRIIYKNGHQLSYVSFSSDLNKNYRPRRGGCRGTSF